MHRAALLTTLALGGALVPTANAAQVMRVGATGSTFASLNAEKVVGAKALRGMKRMTFTVEAIGKVQTNTFGPDYSVVPGPVVPWPDGTAALNYSLSCSERSSYDSGYRSGTHNPGFGWPSSVTIRIPLAKADRCRISVYGSAYMSGVTYPDEDLGVTYTVTANTKR